MQLDVVSEDADPKRPLGQGEQALAPARLYVPGGHGKAVPLTDPEGQKYPLLQGEHDPASAPLKRPAMHRIIVVLEVPAGHANPAVQLPGHPLDTLKAPATVPNLPAGHIVQLAELPALCVPGGHNTAVEFEDPGGQAYPALQEPPAQPMAALCARDTVPNKPPAQRVQVAAPELLKEPAPHLTAVEFAEPGGQA